LIGRLRRSWALSEQWAIDLGRFVFRGGGPEAQLNDAIAFFSRAFELAQEYQQHAVVRFAVVAAQRWLFPAAGWRTFQGLLFNAVTADPASFPVAIVLFDRHVAAGRTVNRTAARSTIESIVARHAPLGHGSEVAWALWMAIQFAVALFDQTAAVVSSMEDDVVALLALDANQRGLFSAGALNTTTWQALASAPDALGGEHWLLAYEGNRKGWLQCPTVGTHAFFSVLEANQISFYDPTRRLVTFEGAAAAVPGGALGAGYS